MVKDSIIAQKLVRIKCRLQSQINHFQIEIEEFGETRKERLRTLTDLKKKVKYFAPLLSNSCVRLLEFHLTFVHLATEFNSEKPVAAPNAEF